MFHVFVLRNGVSVRHTEFQNYDLAIKTAKLYRKRFDKGYTVEVYGWGQLMRSM